MKTFPYILAICVVPIFLVGVTNATAEWTTLWQAGAPGRGWPLDGVGGGPDVDFVQEAGINPPPGDPNSLPFAQQADDDYYFAGEYPAPIGAVANDEVAFERAFAGIDNDLRIHFNLPELLTSEDLFRFSFEPFNLQTDSPDPRYGVEVAFNGTVIQPELVIRPLDLGTVFTTIEFSLGDVDARTGPGFDNVVSLRGVNYNAEGGGNWMGLDYHHLEVNNVDAPPTGVPDTGSTVFFGLLALSGVGLLRRVLRSRN